MPSDVAAGRCSSTVRFASQRILSLQGNLGIDPAFIRDKVGVETKCFLGFEYSCLDRAGKACENLFARTQLSPGRIKLVVYVTQNPDFRLPHNAALLQERLGR